MSGATQDTIRSARDFNYGTVTLYGYPFQGIRLSVASHIIVLQPQRDKSLWFGLIRFRSPLLTESILFLFLRLLRCFTSAGIALPSLYIQEGVTQYYLRWVAPFGNPRVKAYLPLTEAYRSLSRPSSPDDAKASSNSIE